MSPRIKIFAGMALLLPAAFVVLTTVVFRFEHPEMTEAEIFSETGYIPYVALIGACAGTVLARSGIDADEQEQEPNE